MCVRIELVTPEPHDVRPCYQKYISGKGYIQKNNFLRHLMNHPVIFQHDAISFDETKGNKNNVIIVDLLKKGRNKIQK